MLEEYIVAEIKHREAERPAFNRLDICDAWYLYATLYHGGQWTSGYRIFGRLQAIDFNPGDRVAAGATGPELLT